MTDDRIKSCPFCGSLDLNFVEGSTFRWIVAECQSCGARCGETRVKTLGDQDPDGDKAAALAEWNRRAIEAECRVPDGYVLVPMEPTASQLDVAVSFALNVKLCNDYNWSAYMRDVYARMLAAAPKPEKAEPERKLNSEPTIAAPVAQEPVAFYIYKETAPRLGIQNVVADSLPWVYDQDPSSGFSARLKVYLAPPDQSAEVEHWRKKCLNNYLCINAQDKRIAELEATIEAQRTLYANCIKISHEADELEHKCNRLERQQKVLVEALEESQATMRQWRDYNFHPHCFPENFNRTQLALRKVTEALASVKGNAGIERR